MDLHLVWGGKRHGEKAVAVTENHVAYDCPKMFKEQIMPIEEYISSVYWGGYVQLMASVVSPSSWYSSEVLQT